MIVIRFVHQQNINASASIFTGMLLYPECGGRSQVLIERVVPEGNWFKARAGHLRIYIQDSNPQHL